MLQRKMESDESSLNCLVIKLPHITNCAPHLFGFELLSRKTGVDQGEACYNFLKKNNVDVSLRSGMIRVGIYGYNTKEDMSKLVFFLSEFGEKIGK